MNKSGGDESYLSKALISGTVCAFIASLLNPFDVVKIRIQNNSPLFPWPEKRMIQGLIRLWKMEGIQGWCRGVNASILRELLYSSIRIGAYEPILHLLYPFTHTSVGSSGSSSPSNSQYASPLLKYFCGLLSGGIGSALANPTDLVKVQFQAHIPNTSPPLPFTTTLNAFHYLLMNHGVSGLYKGWMITSTRSAILTSAQIGSYDTIKNNILRKEFQFQDGYSLHFISAMLTGLITTTAANPGELIPTSLSSMILSFDL
jgi:solute carrier family 25 (mitochondrial carrier), member 14/30